MDIYYPSQAKLKRAKDAIENYDVILTTHPRKKFKAEIKLVDKGRAKKLEGDALVDFVYEGLGGAPVLKGSEAKEAEKNAKEAQKRSRDRRYGAAGKRSKIRVK